jgi:hypothetical protein
MKAVLICPAERSAVAAMMEERPLALLSVVGKSFLEHWLEELAVMGATDVLISAADRPEQIRACVGDGARWGLRVQVVPELRELSADEARAKYQAGWSCDVDWLSRPDDFIMADHLPGLAKYPAFESYAGWFRALAALLDRRRFQNYIGLREIRPNVWAGRHTRVADTAVIQPPCWIGANAWVGRHASIGPMCVIEDGAAVDSHASVEASVVGPATYVGPGTDLRNSLALGRTLINWATNAAMVVPERFLLCELARPRAGRGLALLVSRLMALIVLALTLPAASFIALRSWLAGQPAFRLRKAVRPGGAAFPTRAVFYYELLSANRFWRRWPQLWNVFHGDFAWFGNRPLTAMQAGRLTTDFERLWLSAPIGLVSLADAEGCVDSFEEEARAHASFYAAQSDWRLKLSILRRVAALAFLAPSATRREESYPMPLADRVVKHGQL